MLYIYNLILILGAFFLSMNLFKTQKDLLLQRVKAWNVDFLNPVQCWQETKGNYSDIDWRFDHLSLSGCQK